MKRREYYVWLRPLRTSVTIHIELLRFTAGLAAYKCVDGSGQHDHCYRVELVLPILRFVSVLRWGPRPMPHQFSMATVGGFGDIGGRSLMQRQRAELEFNYDDIDD